MTPERILMSVGGEKLEDVFGRKEDDELPKFEAGAFEVDAGEGFGDQRKLVDVEFLNRYVPEGAISRHTMRALLDSIRLVGSSEFKCDQVFNFIDQSANFGCFDDLLLIRLNLLLLETFVKVQFFKTCIGININLIAQNFHFYTLNFLNAENSIFFSFSTRHFTHAMSRVYLSPR